MPAQSLRFEKIAATICAVLIFLLVVYLAVRNEPFADPNIVLLIRITLAVSVAVVANEVFGLLHIQGKIGPFSVKASGALAFGIISYFATPAVLPLEIERRIEINSLIGESRQLVSDGFCDRAIDVANRAVSIDDTRWDTFNTRGIAYFSCESYDEAVTSWRSARLLASDPLNVRAVRFNLGAGLIASGEYEEAASELAMLWAEYVEKSNYEPAIAFNYSLALLLNDEFLEALSVLCSPTRYGRLAEMARIMIGYAVSMIEDPSLVEQQNCDMLERSIQAFSSSEVQNLFSTDVQIPENLKEITPLLSKIRSHT